jgi:hypothetical protein
MKIKMKKIRCISADCGYTIQLAIPEDAIIYCRRCVPDQPVRGDKIPTVGIVDISDAI